MENNRAIQNQLNFEFRGNGMEYFKIWIVNILLTILTLGIYSAWATVRNRRYFYSNTVLDNTSFSYLADPINILKARVIAVSAFIVYSVVSGLSPVAGIAILLVLLLLFPYFLNKSLAFNHRMSAYKNIQFRFSASYKQAFMVMYVWPLLGMLTLGILYPLVFVKVNEYMVKNSAYGTSKFDFNAGYKDYGIIFLIMIGVGLLFGAIVWAISVFVPALAFSVPVLMAVIYFGLIVYFMVETSNLFYRSTILGEHGFTANLTMAGLAKVIITNAFFILITLGLYLPAAKVRMAKYMCSCLVMNAAGSLDTHAAAEKENISALGEQFGEVFDFGM
ncbi:MAG: YjgN family protein [Gammaproteobacteria bacterium]|nr:YjgN family protein [Gammaproteobacteria bacterium]